MKRALLFLGALCQITGFLAGCGTSPAEGLADSGEISADGGGTFLDGTTPQGSSDGATTPTPDGTTTSPPKDGAAARDATFPLDDSAPWYPSDGGGCGYMDAGLQLHVGTDIDLCMPKVACNAEVCPPDLADCVNDECVFRPGYSGVATLTQSWVTYYCELSQGGCRGVTQLQYPEITAQQIATSHGLLLCDQGDGGPDECVGVAASSAMQRR